MNICLSVKYVSLVASHSGKLSEQSQFKMSVAAGGGPIMLKPNKPEPFDGRNYFLVVNTWLYKMEQYLVIMQLNNPVLYSRMGTKSPTRLHFFWNGRCLVVYYGTREQGTTDVA